MTDESFDNLKNHSHIITSGTCTVPCGFANRAQAAINNPVATVLEYTSLLYNIVNIFVGVPLEGFTFMSKSVHTSFYKSHPKGLFGHALAAHGMIETQQRHSGLHFHMVIPGSLPPALLQRIAEYPDLCKIVQDALDAIYCAELP